MQIAQKVIFNTAVLYTKILVTMVVALVSVPLVLKALGASDYGLYNLVAGIIAMLSFFNNSMTVSSQRYMSVAMGEGNDNKINDIYNSSFVLHIIFATCIVFILEVIGLPSIGKLNIDPDRIWYANLIFQFLIISTFSKVISVPFDAIINAHEDMLVFSVIELIDSFLLLVTAFVLKFIQFDKLTFYGLCIVFIAILTLVMKLTWCLYKYKKYRLTLTKYASKSMIKEMLGFTSWNLFGGLAMMGRNQGVAVIFNIFLGTLANAAYGIANQLNGAMAQFSSTFSKAINPQLMKSEGMGDRLRLHKISFISSKFSVLALCLFSIPLNIEIADVLHLWLGKDIPEFTVELSRCILVLSIVTQFSVGLMSAIQATGNIKKYQITMGLIILLNIPAAYIILKFGYPIYYVTMSFILLEVVSLIIRIFMAHNIVGISIRDFGKEVVKPCLIIVSISTVASMFPFLMIKSIWFRLIIVSIIYVMSYIILIWYIALSASQKNIVLATLAKVKDNMISKL